jgi:pimeloyl-ACP methyl ester carboxylesterase
MGRPGRPVVFIHGLWKSSAIWSRWVDRFVSEGYRAVAPLWPYERASVEESRQHAADLEGLLLIDAVEHFEAQLEQLDEPPILIGHSFGALIAERILATGKAIAAVAIDPAQPGSALPGSLERLRRINPDYGMDPLGSSVVTLTFVEFHRAFCAEASDEAAKTYYDSFYIPASVNPLLEVASAGFRLIPNLPESPTGPLLLIPTSRTSPDREIEDPTIRKFRDAISVEENFDFVGAGHSLVFDHQWEKVADAVIDWLADKGLRN